jgi:hypothetical protein
MQDSVTQFSHSLISGKAGAVQPASLVRSRRHSQFQSANATAQALIITANTIRRASFCLASDTARSGSTIRTSLPYIRACGRNPNIALDVQHGIAIKRLGAGEFSNWMTGMLELDQRVGVNAVSAVATAATVGGCQQARSFGREVSRGVLANRTESLHNNARAVDAQITEIFRDLQGHT